MKNFNNIGKAIDFIEYISKNMNKEDLELLYRINNIKKERLELFSDFINYLNNLIINTYLGDDITIGKNKVKHFEWCWSKIVESFKKEGIYFVDCNDLYQYFLTFYQESFYEEDKDINNINKITMFWDDLFDFDKVKTMSEYEVLIELYKIFNKSFTVN